jgi:hypothetical protein
MAKTLNEKELQAGIDNAVLSVIDTCGADVDSAISNGMKAEYRLGSSILSESEQIHLTEGEKRTGDAADKKIEKSIRQSRNAIVDGLIESGRFDFGRTKFLDAVRIAAKFPETQFENLSAEFNRTAIVELASVADEKVEKAIDAVRAATDTAKEKDKTPPNVREIVKGFKPTARKSSSVPFPLKVAEALADGYGVDFFAKLSSEKGLPKKEANEALAGLFVLLAGHGMDVEKAAERKRADAKTAEEAVEKKPAIDNIKTPEGEDFSYGSEAYEKRRAELVAEGLEQAI